MTAEAASDGDAPRAAANGEAAKNQTGPGSPVACSDGARAAATVGGLALLLQVIVLIVN